MQGQPPGTKVNLHLDPPGFRGGGAKARQRLPTGEGLPMGIEDREYAREDGRWRSSRPTWRSMNSMLIFANLTVMGIQILIPDRIGMFGWPTDPLSDFGHFSTEEVQYRGGLEFWRVLTFQFLHANLVHLFMNMMGLYCFGDLVEARLGPKRFLGFYLTCGVCGALMYFVLNALGHWIYTETQWRIPGFLFEDPRTPLVGASAGVFGVIMACAKIKPDAEASLFMLPVPIRLKPMAYIYVGFAFVSLLFGTRNAGGEAAHIGGAIAGFVLIRNAHLLRDFFDVFGDSRKQPKGRRTGKERARGDGSAMEKRVKGGGASARRDAELERILAKISATTIESLTADEKTFLDRATEEKRREERLKEQYKEER